MKRLLYVLFAIGDPPEAWAPRRIGNPDFDSYRRWWLDNAPAWNVGNQHDYNIGLIAWLDARYLLAVEGGNA